MPLVQEGKLETVDSLDAMSDTLDKSAWIYLTPLLSTPAAEKDMARRRRPTRGNPSISSNKISGPTDSPEEKLTDLTDSPQLSTDDLGSFVTESCVLPTWTPWLVSLITLVFRVYHVIDPSNWWVLHADEIFQSMEVAHSQLYGYGLRPYEFNRPPKGDNLSQYETKDLSLGMYALRSPVYPQFMVFVVWLASSLGVHVNQPYVIFRLSHVMISSTLPLAVSKLTLAICRCPDVASLAAILTGMSAYLNVMGTHTLVNSFVSPAIFLGLAGLVDLIQSTDSNDVEYTRVISKDRGSSSSDSRNSSNGYSKNTGSSNITTKTSNTSSTMGYNVDRDKVCPKEDNEATAGHEGCRNFNRIAAAKINIIGDNCPLLNTSRSVISGFLLALAVYIRPDAALFLAAMLLVRCQHIRVMSLLASARARWMALGISAGLALGAADDFIFYNDFVLSPVNWFRFNVWNDVSSQLFGVAEPSFYFHSVLLNGFGMILVSVLYALALFYACFTFQQQNDRVISLRQNVCCTILLTAVYSCSGHKEERFVHDVIVLYLITVSQFVIEVTKSISNFQAMGKEAAFVGISPDRLGSKCRTVAISLFLCVFIASQAHTFQTTTRSDDKQWVFSSTRSGQDTNLGLHFLSQQDDVTGVFIERTFHDTGGYTLLHHNVPLMYMVGHAVFEF
ncbi:hypothetical protein EGW08_017235, partial [Elysia chlorotica]